MIASYLRSSLAAALYAVAPLARAKPARLSPAEARPATQDVLDRLSFAQERTAMVLSLWTALPARQCAVTPRYVMAPEDRVYERATLAPEGVRALQARLAAAGFVAGAMPVAEVTLTESARRAA